MSDFIITESDIKDPTVLLLIKHLKKYFIVLITLRGTRKRQIEKQG